MNKLSGREILIYLFCIKNNFDWEKTYDDIKDKVFVFDIDVAIKDIDNFTKDKRCITLVDDDYPNDLKSYLKPPFVIICGECNHDR